MFEFIVIGFFVVFFVIPMLWALLTKLLPEVLKEEWQLLKFIAKRGWK